MDGPPGSRLRCEHCNSDSWNISYIKDTGQIFMGCDSCGDYMKISKVIGLVARSVVQLPGGNPNKPRAA